MWKQNCTISQGNHSISLKNSPLNPKTPHIIYARLSSILLLVKKVFFLQSFPLGQKFGESWGKSLNK